MGQIPEYVTVFHPRCTYMHTRAHAHTCTHTGRWPVGSWQRCSSAPGCSSFSCPQRHHGASRGGVEEAGGTRGATIPRGRRESGANPDPSPTAATVSPFFARGRRGHGQLRLPEGGREPLKGGAQARRGEGNQGKGSRRTRRAGLPLEASFSSLGLVTFPLIDPSLLDKVRSGDGRPRRAGRT